MDKTFTVNEAMVLSKALRGRLGELSHLRDEVSTKTSWYEGGNPSKVVEPQYDIKAVDRKCVELENALLTIETAIKQSNATTSIKLSNVDAQELLSPLK